MGRQPGVCHGRRAVRDTAGICHHAAARQETLAGGVVPDAIPRDIDARLLAGAVLFGMGWGLVGYCPGPAIASLLTGGMDAIIFIASLALGMAAAKQFTA